jgi:hypothetical protein
MREPRSQARREHQDAQPFASDHHETTIKNNAKEFGLPRQAAHMFQGREMSIGNARGLAGSHNLSSPFMGTHFVGPRTDQAELGFAF